MRTRTRALSCVLATLVAAGAATSARADVVNERAPRDAGADRLARERTEQARRLYQRGDYAGASEAYREAYRLRPSPGVMFNLGQSYRQDGRCAEAADAYRAVLASDLTGPARELAEQQLDSVETCVRAVVRNDRQRALSLRRKGLVTMGIGGAALVVATGLAVADDDRRGGTSPVTIGLAFGGGAVLATGAVFYVVAQNRMREPRARRGPEIGVWRVPVGTTRVAGVTWKF